MIGAILGDIIGSPYEWHNTKSKDFPLFRKRSHYTDDSVMTVAVAAGILEALEQSPEGTDFPDETLLREELVRNIKHYGRLFPHAGYGGRFFRWLDSSDTEPYNSWGNGSAMRTSAAAWLFDDLESVRKAARIQSAVTHDHPEGIKGAEAVASAIFLARTGASKDEIRDYVTEEFGYDLTRTCEEIRPDYEFDVSCQGSVPEAIIAFLEGTDYEDVVRTAVSLGGDSDTIAAMAGSIAEAYYGVPEELEKKLELYLPEALMSQVRRFGKARK